MNRLATLIVCTTLLAACGGKKPAPESTGPPAETQTADPLETACRAGTVKSCLAAAATAESRGDVQNAAELYGTACDLEDPNGCVLAAQVIIDEDLALAREYFERGCALGDATACYGVGMSWSSLFPEADVDRARGGLEKSCGMGFMAACNELAGYYQRGEGVEVDLEREEALRTQACEGGDGEACITLSARARETDPNRANELLERACESDGRGCTLRGLVDLKVQDAESARGWFEKGCTAEFADPDSCAWYGWHVWSGFGGEASKERGVALLDASCEASSAVGCTFRGVVEARAGGEPGPWVDRACAIDEVRCDSLRGQFESLASE